MISYYELLGMVKVGKEPKKINVKLCCYNMNYIAQYDGGKFDYYRIEFPDSVDENYKFYLSECYLEHGMLEPTITILKERTLEKGMFVRDTSGEIHTCTAIYKEKNNSSLNRFENDYGNIIMFDDIVGEPSYGVADLIKIGDIVECYVYGLEDDGITSIKRLETQREVEEFKDSLLRGNKRLFGFISKEQISYSYKVGE